MKYSGSNSYNQEIQDSILKVAVLESAQSLGQQAMKEANPSGKLSELELHKFKRLFKQTVRKQRVNSFASTAGKVLNRVAIFIAIFVIVSAALVMSVDAIREQVTQWLVTINKQDTSLQLKGAPLIDYSKDYKTEDFLPTYIPEGFSEGKISGQMPDINFHCDSTTGIIALETHTADTEFYMDTTAFEELGSVPINKANGFLLRSEDYCAILMSHNNIQFYVYSQAGEEETLKMARSIPFTNTNIIAD